MKIRKGIALVLVLGTLTVLFTGGMVISQLMTGVQDQLKYTDAAIRAQYIAESAFNLLMARLMGRPYNQRWFKTAGGEGKTSAYSGGYYDYFISDTPNRVHHVDIWIRSSFGNIKRVFFWRVNVQQALLPGVVQGATIGALELQEADFPTSSGSGQTNSDSLSGRLDSIVAERQAKAEATERAVEQIKSNPKLTSVVSQVVQAPQENPVRQEAFTPAEEAVYDLEDTEESEPTATSNALQAVEQAATPAAPPSQITHEPEQIQENPPSAVPPVNTETVEQIREASPEAAEAASSLGNNIESSDSSAAVESEALDNLEQKIDTAVQEAAPEAVEISSQVSEADPTWNPETTNPDNPEEVAAAPTSTEIPSEPLPTELPPDPVDEPAPVAGASTAGGDGAAAFAPSAEAESGNQEPEPSPGE